MHLLASRWMFLLVVFGKFESPVVYDAQFFLCSNCMMPSALNLFRL